MSRVTTILTGFEVRTGGDASRPWRAVKFSDQDGKKYEVFNDADLEAKGKSLIDQQVVIDFSTKTTPKKDGDGVWVNNDVNGLYKLGEEPETEAAPKQRGGGGRNFDPGRLTLAIYVNAFDAALTLIGTGMLGDDAVDSVEDIDKVALLIIERGKAAVGAAAPAPAAETTPEAAPAAEAVPN